MHKEDRYGNPTENLFNAIGVNNLDLAKLAIKDGADLASLTSVKIAGEEYQTTPAVAAAKSKCWDILDAIASSAMDAGNYKFEGALLYAIQERQLSSAVILLNHSQVSYFRLAATKDNALHVAVKSNWPEMVALLLYFGYEDNRKNKADQSAKQINETCYLKGWEIWQKNRDSHILFGETLTPIKRHYGNPSKNLFNAITINNLDLAKQAIKDGADLASLTSLEIAGETYQYAPAVFASRNECWDILDAIASSAMDTSNNYQFAGALLHAIQERQLSSAVILLNHSRVSYAYITTTGDRGLHLAVKNNCPEMVALLLSHGYRDNKKNKADQTAQQINEGCYLRGWEIWQNNRAAADISIVLVQAMRQQESNPLCHLSRLTFDLFNKILTVATDVCVFDENKLENQQARLMKISTECFIKSYRSKLYLHTTPASDTFVSTLESVHSTDEISSCINHFVNFEHSKETNTIKLLRKFNLYRQGDYGNYTEYKLLLLNHVIALLKDFFSEFKKVTNIILEKGQMIMISDNEDDISILMAYCTELNLTPKRIDAMQMVLGVREEIDFFIFNKCRMPPNFYQAFPDFFQQGKEPEKQNCIIS